MDFIDLANGLDQVTATLLRHLTTTDDMETGDDDFARIDGEYESHPTSSSAGAQQVPSSPSSSSSSYYYGAPEDVTNGSINRPLLSPTAEAELYLLATNFLLCKFQRKNNCNVIV